MTTESLTIILPIPPSVLSPNSTIGSIGSRMMKASASKRYRRLAREAIEAEEVATAPWRLASVRVAFYYGNTRRHDEDNAMGSLKAAYDGIVDSGLLIDDDHTHMKRHIPEFSVDKLNPRVMLEITRLE